MFVSLTMTNIFSGIVDSILDRFRLFSVEVIQSSHSTWKTWKNESIPGKPGNIMEF